MGNESHSGKVVSRRIRSIIFAACIIAMAIVPVGAQNAVPNTVPPTARQAATMPQFASRLAHPGRVQVLPQTKLPPHARQQYSSSHMGATSPQDDMVIYENGPVNGNVDAWTINFGYVVGDTFTVPSGGGTVDSLSFATWLFPGDVVTSVDVSITSQPFGGTSYFAGTVALTQTNLSTNGFGYQIASRNRELHRRTPGWRYLLGESAECQRSQRRSGVLGRELWYRVSV